MKATAKKDKRIREIFSQLRSFSEGDFTHYLSISERVDEIDALIAGLNVLREALVASCYASENKEERIRKLLEILLRYAAMDFSKKADISHAGDEIDALAAGLNVVREEVVHRHGQLKDSEEQIRLLKATPEQRVMDKD